MINSFSPSVLTELLNGGKYFIISADIQLPSSANSITELKIENSSVLDFRGGSFYSNNDVELDLSVCQVCAAPYPIFGKQIKLVNYQGSEIKAEWFKSADDASDDLFINRAIASADGCPVVLQARTYTLKGSIRFLTGNRRMQTLVCPGTLRVTKGDYPAIDINTQHATLKINEIVGTETYFVPTPDHKYESRRMGTGVLFSVYSDYCDVEVNSMSGLGKGFCVQPDTYGKKDSHGKSKSGGIQYCRIKFDSISADFCFYLDVFSKAQFNYTREEKIDEEHPTGTFDLKKDAIPTDLWNCSIGCQNWFNENRVYGNLMQGLYGIYVVGPEDISGYNNQIDPRKVGNVMNGLIFENISFEKIKKLPVRLRSMMRSCVLNLQMYNSLPGNDPNGADDFTPWVDMKNTKEVRISFNSYVLPNHFKIGDNCYRCYISGAVLDRPGHWDSHFDMIGIDSLADPSDTEQSISQMYFTNSVQPFNMTKKISVPIESGTVVTKYLIDLLPNMREGAGTGGDKYIDLPVLPMNVNVEVQENQTIILDLTGLNSLPPCLYTVNANINSGGKLQFKGALEGGAKVMAVTSSGEYSIQRLSDWTLRIAKV